MKRLIVILIILTGTAVFLSAKTPAYRNRELSVEERIADLLPRMTLEEKAGQLLCPMGWEMYEKRNDGKAVTSRKFRELQGSAMAPGSYWAVLRADPWTQKTLTTGLSPRQSAEALNVLQRFALDSTRLGIPILFAEECPHGHMAIGTTVFPTGLGMASTWNRRLLREAGEAIALEARLQGAGVGYGPVLDVARDPRWSRMEETLGEDPYLIGELGAAIVKGMQGERLNDGRHLFSTLKHFAAYGIPQGGHNGAEASVGPIRLHSDYLAPFRKAVKTGAATVMTSYNTIDGIPCTADRDLIEGILRKKWGFNGAVFSDLYSIDGIAGAGVASDRMESGALALKAGVDIDLGAACYGDRLLDALRKDLVSEADIDRAVANVLRLKFELGLFENPYVDPELAEKTARSAVHKELARETARQGTVLLKNNGILPLPEGLIRKIAVIGPNADTQYNQLGDYTAPQDEREIVTVLEGIRQIAGPSTEVVYVKGCAVRDTTASDISAAALAALDASVAVVVVGGSSARDFKTEYIATGAASPESAAATLSDMDCGEGFDRSSLALLGDQEKLLEAVLATGTPTVVVYIQGRPLDMNLAAEKASALLCAWYPGEEGGNAIAEILFGKENPSGRLPVSIPRSSAQLPVHYSASSRRDYIDGKGDALFPFGYGLSYTEFRYSDLRVIPDGADNWKAVCRITNTGEREGAETPQLYVSDLKASVSQPPLLLKGFDKIRLKPGESAEVSFPLGFEELSIYGRDLRRVVEPGKFKISIGASSSDLRLENELEVDHEIKEK